MKHMTEKARILFFEKIFFFLPTDLKLLKLARKGTVSSPDRIGRLGNLTSINLKGPPSICSFKCPFKSLSAL